MIGADLRDLLSAFCDADARFLVIGGYAVGIHGLPRATKDLDVWVEANATNARRVMRALVAFGAPLFGLTAADLEQPGIVLQIGLPPNRIDVTTKIDGVSFRRAWPRRIYATFSEGLVCPVIGLQELLANKRASGRPQDLADVDALERLFAAPGAQIKRTRGSRPRSDDPTKTPAAAPPAARKRSRRE
jgi:hypothetical protein